jgi:hypothetical protein
MLLRLVFLVCVVILVAPARGPLALDRTGLGGALEWRQPIEHRLVVLRAELECQRTVQPSP